MSGTRYIPDSTPEKDKQEVTGSEGNTKRNLEALHGELEAGRLHHAILFHGKSLAALEEDSLSLCRNILGMEPNQCEHPDLFHLRPSGKARTISVESTRELIADLHQSSIHGERKVAILHEADRMRRNSANAFLKTLEEPPRGTYLIMLSTRPYSLLTTIRSRCIQIRIEDARKGTEDSEWEDWLERYADWLKLVTDRVAIRQDRIAPILRANGLILGFRALLASKSEETWESRKATLPEGLEEKEIEAIETGIRKGARTNLLAALEEKTREIIVSASLSKNQEIPGHKLAKAIEALEKAAGLLEVNLKEETALEYFWLTSLRAWAAK